MIELIVLIIIEVHGNNPTPFSPSHTSLPIGLHTFQLDNSHGHRCLESTLKKCEYILKLHMLEHCIVRNLFKCLFENPIHLNQPIHERLDIVSKCILFCLGMQTKQGYRLAPCLLDYYEKLMNNH
jgi:hypothetical protein